MSFAEGNFDGLRGNRLLVDTAVAEERGWRIGDTVGLVMQNGQEREMQLNGRFAPNNALATYLISTKTYVNMGGGPLRLRQPLPDAGTATRNDENVSSALPVVDIKDPAQFQEQESAQVDQMLMIVTALLVLSVLISVLGVVNTLALSVIERTRELGLLRAGHRGGLRRRDHRGTAFTRHQRGGRAGRAAGRPPWCSAERSASSQPSSQPGGRRAAARRHAAQ